MSPTLAVEHELEKKMGPADGAEALNPMELRLAAELAAGAWRPSQAGTLCPVPPAAIRTRILG